MCHSVKLRAQRLGLQLPSDKGFLLMMMLATGSSSDEEMDEKIDRMPDEFFLAIVESIMKKWKRTVGHSEELVYIR